MIFRLLRSASALWRLRRIMKQAEHLYYAPYRPMKLKPGIKTTEFWMTLGIGLADVILASLGMIDGTWAAISLTVLGGVYTAVRGLLKVDDGE